MKLTKNFDSKEFACKGDNCCGNSDPISIRLVEALQELREKVGKPLIISSGFRCNIHNATMGGAIYSYHRWGLAVDVLCPKGLDIETFKDVAMDIKTFKGIGVYDDPPRLHLDIRQGEPWFHDYRGLKLY